MMNIFAAMLAFVLSGILFAQAPDNPDDFSIDTESNLGMGATFEEIWADMVSDAEQNSDCKKDAERERQDCLRGTGSEAECRGIYETYVVDCASSQ